MQADGEVEYQACFDATPPDSDAHRLAAINLGTEAYLAGDAATALRFYDAAETPGKTVSSDLFFHTFRADARAQGGRDTEAQADATLAWRMLKDPASSPTGLGAGMGAETLDDPTRFGVLMILLPILKGGDPAVLQEATAGFAALTLTDWTQLSDQAAMLEGLDALPQALAASTRALALAPDEPVVLNTHCYVLTRSGRGAEGVPYCERAIAAEGDLPVQAKAAIRHSLASALAGAGRCRESEARLSEAQALDPANPTYREALACTAA